MVSLDSPNNTPPPLDPPLHTLHTMESLVKAHLWYFLCAHYFNFFKYIYFWGGGEEEGEFEFDYSKECASTVLCGRAIEFVQLIHGV